MPISLTRRHERTQLAGSDLILLNKRLLLMSAVTLVALTACSSTASNPATREGTASSSTPAEAQSSSVTASPSVDSAAPTDPAMPTFVVSKDKVRGPDRITAMTGDKVVFSVTADRADEVHVHGYDVMVPVRPGRASTVRLRAEIPGVFEVELEDSHLLLTQLRVSP